MVILGQLIRGRNVGFIAEGYLLAAGRLSQVFRKSLPSAAEAFSIGEHQFLVDSQFASTAESWNRWGGNHPVLRYYLEDSRPMSNSMKVIEKGKLGKEYHRPVILDLERHPKPSSGTVNLLIRRKGIAIMIEATKKVAMNPIVAGLVGAMVAGAGVFLLTSMFHPGLVSSPPPGYYFKVLPIPENVTVVH